MYRAAVKRGKKSKQRRGRGKRLAQQRMLKRKARTGRKGQASKRKGRSRAIKVKIRKRRLARRSTSILRRRQG
ncbi:hypothetical protein BZG21_40175 [Escherichia coli]|nr:hypothetical protein [Escherichia coli]